MLRVLLCFVFISAIASVPTDPATVITTTTPPTDECDCSYHKIWLDIMVVVDTSSNMTSDGLSKVKNVLWSVINQMTVGQGYGHESRIGLVTYDSFARTPFTLNAFQSTEEAYQKMNPQYTGRTGSNIEKAIQLASTVLEGSGHRPNAKKVIILFASSFDPETSTDPKPVAETFKKGGGIIITVEFVPDPHQEVPILKDLSTSSCYQLSNKKGDLEANELLDVLCKANCFCKPNWIPYLNKNECHNPRGGCFFRVLTEHNQTDAESYCVDKMGGMLPKVDSEEKAIFLLPLVYIYNTVWIGLKRRGGKYLWMDGSELGKYRPFQWHNNVNHCVTQFHFELNEPRWAPIECEYSFYHMCEAKPCNTGNYCSDVAVPN